MTTKDLTRYDAWIGNLDALTTITEKRTLVEALDTIMQSAPDDVGRAVLQLCGVLAIAVLQAKHSSDAVDERLDNALDRLDRRIDASREAHDVARRVTDERFENLAHARELTASELRGCLDELQGARADLRACLEKLQAVGS
jgi:hypothetical protein